MLAADQAVNRLPPPRLSRPATAGSAVAPHQRQLTVSERRRYGAPTMVSSPNGAPHMAGESASDAGRERAVRAVERLSASGVEVVLLAFFDNAGVLRKRAVSLARLAEAATSGVGLSTAWHVVTVTDRVTWSAPASKASTAPPVAIC